MQRLTEEMENQIAEYLAEKYKTKFETVTKQDVFILALVSEVNFLRQTVVGIRGEMIRKDPTVARCQAEDAAIKRALENGS